LFRDYWEKAEEYDYLTHGPWPLTRCPWIPERKLAHWRKTLPPDKYRADVLGEFASSMLNVFDREDVESAFSHGRFEIDANYKTMTGIDWGFSVSKTVFLPGQLKGKALYVPGPPNVFEHVRYPKVMKWAREKYFPLRQGEVYADGSHPGEIQRLERIRGLDVHAIFFSKHKKQLTEIIETLLFQRRLIISDDNETLKTEMLAHCRDSKEKVVKKNDDTVDALRCLCYFAIEMGLEALGPEEEDTKDPDDDEDYNIFEDESKEWLPYLIQ
jgi:hypothetical protein